MLELSLNESKEINGGIANHQQCDTGGGSSSNYPSQKGLYRGYVNMTNGGIGGGLPKLPSHPY